MLRRVRVGPSMVVASLALFFSLAGLGVAAGVVPLAKRALSADNALKLQGKSASQVAALGRSSGVAGSVSVRSSPWSLAPAATGDLPGACASGEKVVGGGFDHSSGDVLAMDSRPGSDGASWKVALTNLSPTKGASGNVYAICAH